MSTYNLPYPAELADRLRVGEASIHVLPFDADHGRCAAYCADHYEITGCYIASDVPLDELERRLAQISGVYATTQWYPYHDPDITNPDWPERRVKYLRRAARMGDNGSYVRPRVFAMIADTDEESCDD